jgi:hypothetical protein
VKAYCGFLQYSGIALRSLRDTMILFYMSNASYGTVVYIRRVLQMRPEVHPQ